jgi:DNA-binding transcriptional ArsR family regulator
MLAERCPSMTRQGVTKHLNVLAAAGIIEGSREGREHVWTLNPARLAEARRCLDVIGREWDDALTRLKHHVEET